MPEQQPRESPEQERQRATKRKDPFHGFDFTIEGIAGMSTVVPPLQIPDDHMVALYNYLPVAQKTIRKVKAPLEYCTLPNDAIRVVNDVLIGLGAQLAFNGSFETAGTPLFDWFKVGNPQVFEQDQVIRHSGFASAHINDSVPTSGGFNQPISFIPGTQYRIGFWY